jgi:hypothetical protein
MPPDFRIWLCEIPGIFLLTLTGLWQFHTYAPAAAAPIEMNGGRKEALFFCTVLAESYLLRVVFSPK